MLSIRFDEKREWWVSSAVFDRLFQVALAGGYMEPELQEWQHVAAANGGLGFDIEERDVAEKLERALTAAARSEVAALADADPQGEDGTYKASLEKLLAATAP